MSGKILFALTEQQAELLASGKFDPGYGQRGLRLARNTLAQRGLLRSAKAWNKYELTPLGKLAAALARELVKASPKRPAAEG